MTTTTQQWNGSLLEISQLKKIITELSIGRQWQINRWDDNDIEFETSGGQAKENIDKHPQNTLLNQSMYEVVA